VSSSAIRTPKTREGSRAQDAVIASSQALCPDVLAHLAVLVELADLAVGFRRPETGASSSVAVRVPLSAAVTALRWSVLERRMSVSTSVGTP